MIRWVVEARRAHRRKRGCRRPRQTSATNPPRQSRDRGASRTPPPTVVARCRFQQSREVQFITPVTLYAATFDTHQLVGCTVLGAPRSDYCRAALDAAVWLDRQHPRHPRRTCLHSPPHESNPAGAARAPFFTGAPTSSFHQRREGVEALPYGRHPHLIRAARNPSVTARSAATAPLSGEPRGGVRRTHVSVIPRRAGVEDKPLRRAGRVSQLTHLVRHPASGAR